MKQSDRDTIYEIVHEGFEDYARILYAATHDPNYYRATENVLRAYPKLKKLMEEYDEYQFTPIGRDKSITVAPPKGEMRDHDEALEDSIAAAHRRYQRTKARVDELDEILALYADDERLTVVERYYFSEERVTFDDIADEMGRNVNTVRKWRSSLVREMAVLLFGKEAALSIETRKADVKTS